ncbi:hypothetical protein BU15DRAFT_44465 [Melanogaster broomeanus]|nr:hypothetical protein BU15DRAFT_44465 [Melanogaster broomeanus]
MGRVREHTAKAPQLPQSPKRTRRKRPASSTKSLKVIERLKEAGKEAHLKANNTRRCYTGHVKRGREWLSDYFSGNDRDADSDEEGSATAPNHPHAEEDPYSDPAFPHAFDSIPNKCSDKALALFLTYKGFHQNLGKGTFEGIRAAFKHLWDNVQGDTYRGRWHFDQTKQRWEGNPADSAEVDDVVSSLKHKASSEDGDRKHSLPMSKDFMDRMLAWSLEACPLLDEALRALKQRTLVTRHLEQIAFAATAWTLWTRQAHLKLHSVNDIDLSTYFDIYLKNRKGWQRKVDKGQTEPDLRSNHYKIYPQPDLRGSDAFVWLLLWMKWLEVFHYVHALGPDDCVFPAMGANGVVQPRELLSHDTVQKWINEATSGAGIPGSFSTHCFRRGGAQYRFMFSPVGQRWSLAKVRWWGGWAEQENRDTLIRYLLDELHTYETDYSDALAPVPREVNESLLGEATLVEPMSTEELRDVHTSITTDVRGLRIDLDHVAGARPLMPLTIKIPPRRVQVAAPAVVLASSVPSPLSSSDLAPVSPGMTSGPARTNGVPGGKTRRIRSSHSTPTPGVLIPHIPVLCSDGTRRPRADSWRDIVQHWVTGAPELGLHTPLKDWPRKWTQGENRLFAVKYHERATIALEFLNTYESDEDRFLTAYPQAERGHTALLHAINAARRERGDRPSRLRRNCNPGVQADE